MRNRFLKSFSASVAQAGLSSGRMAATFEKLFNPIQNMRGV